MQNIHSRSQGRVVAFATSLNYNAQSTKEEDTRYTRLLCANVIDANIRYTEDLSCIRIIRKIVSNPNTKLLGMVTTISSVLLTIGPIYFQLNRQHVAADREQWRFSQRHPFLILVCKVSCKEVHLPKHIKVTFTTNLSRVLFAIKSVTMKLPKERGPGIF